MSSILWRRAAASEAEITECLLSQAIFPLSIENYEAIPMYKIFVETLLLQQFLLPAIEEDTLGLFHTALSANQNKNT